MSEVDTNDSPPYMNVEDTYVIISHKGDDPPTPVPTAQSFIRRMNLDEGEEIEVLWDHASFEDDIRMSFATGRDGIWRQFLVDLPREDLHVRGVKTADPSVATDAMCNLLRDVVKKRKEAVPLAPPPKPRVDMLNAAYYERLFSSWIGQGVTSSGWLLVPEDADEDDMCNIVEEEEEPCDLSVPIFRPILPTEPPKAFSIPQPTPETAELFNHLDTLVMFCQQPVLGMAFEELHKRYSCTDFNIHVGDGLGRKKRLQLHVEAVHSGTNVRITATKKFRVFRLDEEANTNVLGSIMVKLEVHLFDEQQVRLCLSSSSGMDQSLCNS